VVATGFADEIFFAAVLGAALTGAAGFLWESSALMLALYSGR